ncbi:acetylornithine deacetylase [Phreatobacter oligotrophus]|jgi:acetylornithine deacetylase|uniref:acetylornithine deacetylase n=1 Tax=Phreatobacter oligotrophus TaxID=1122261 RepID=UPI00235769D6|nr:acetylornithine deacetylase [Phreatobacter oligotrophus]MBX9991574.1 acetylornithine deacetylase [Phreatobacter oligotrophus]
MTQTSIQLLERLVGFPTVSDASNLDLVAWIRDYLAGHGVGCEIVPMPDGRNANIWATIGPKVDGGIVLSGHLDVVPVEGQPWTTDPFTLIRKGDKLYGRGACDMKGFDACVLAAVPAMVAADLKRPIHICLTADEEIRMDGARALIARLGQDWTRPSACIVGEPSRMKVVTGHKGYIRIDTHVRGHEVHSSQRYNGVSAVFVAARLISWMEDRDLRNKAEAEAHGGVPYFDPGWTMLHVGTMQGGTAHNITALDAHFVTGIRVVPGDDGEKYVREYEDFVRREIEPAIKAVHPDAGVTITWRVGGQPLVREEDGEAERIARRLTGDNGIQVVPYGAEAGLFQTAGISTIICGPGDIAQAHQPDEWIEIAELERCDAFIAGLIRECSR